MKILKVKMHFSGLKIKCASIDIYRLIDSTLPPMPRFICRSTHSTQLMTT